MRARRGGCWGGRRASRWRRVSSARSSGSANSCPSTRWTSTTFRSARVQAIILAGGEGLRLRPLTFTIPKPLMPVGEEPIMQRLIARLRASGVKEIGVATGYGFDLVEAYFKDGARLGVQLHYVREVAKLGTAGPLAAFAEWARGPVIIVNGDILTLQDFGAFHDFHVTSGAEMTVGVRSWELRVPFGVIDTDGGRVVE